MKGKNVLTTGDVAKICNVAPRTVSKWFDNGQLKGYRIPGSKDRRIPVSELIRFMKEHNMPTTAVPSSKTRVLIVDSDEKAASALEAVLLARDYEVRTARSNIDTGLAVQKFIPHVLLVNLSAQGIDAEEIREGIRANEDFQGIKIIALGGRLSDPERAALLERDFDGYISDSGNTDGVFQEIEEATTVIC